MSIVYSSIFMEFKWRSLLWLYKMFFWNSWAFKLLWF